MNTVYTRILIMVLATILLGAVPLHAEPHSKPISDRVILWELSLPNGQLIKHAAREGTMLKVRDSAEGWYYGFTPVIGDEGTVRFTVFEITEVAPGQHTLRQVDLSTAEIGTKRQTVTVHGFAIEAKQVLESGPFTSSDCNPIRGNDPFSNNVLTAKGRKSPDGGVTAQGCCVTCESTTACNCGVWMSCGECCVGACCDL